MKLTSVERWILSNQYTILEAICPEQKEDFQDAREIVERGYEAYYPEITRHITGDADVITAEVSDEVIDILTMLDRLNFAYQGLKDKSGIAENDLRFSGFDGNDAVEVKYMAFARWACTRKEWSAWTALPKAKSVDWWNSHMPHLDYYRRMMKAWKASADKSKLTRDDVVRILAAGSGHFP